MTQEIIDASRKYCGAVAVSAYPPYDEMIAAIHKLSSNGIKTNIHFVLDGTSISTAIDWLKELHPFLSNINAIIFLNYKPVGRIEITTGLLRESPQLQTLFDEIQKSHLYKIGFDSCCVSGLAAYTKTSPIFFDGCDAGRFSMFISEDLRALPCSFMINTHRGSDLRKNKIIDVWKGGEEFIKIRNRKWSDKCNNCSKNQICLGGCPNWDSINLCRDPK